MIDLVGKSAELKRFECSSPGKELKAQTDITNKQYQKLGDTNEFDEIKNKRLTPKSYSNPNLIYEANHSFFKYYFDKKNLITFLTNQSFQF